MSCCDKYDNKNGVQDNVAFRVLEFVSHDRFDVNYERIMVFGRDHAEMNLERSRR
jgi:hypothetical protein